LSIDLHAVKARLAPQGTLRAGLNLSNSLLNKGMDAQGVWQGVAPDLARAIAQKLDVCVEFVAYATPSLVTAAIARNEWTIAMIATDPARSGAITFTRPYAHIEAAYMVPGSSAIRNMVDVDQPGYRVVAYKGSAYGLWLERHLRHATLVDAGSFEDAFLRFRAGEADVLASLIPKLTEDLASWPTCRVLNEPFMTVQQAVACNASDSASVAFLRDFIDDLNTSSLIEDLIHKHQAQGLRPATSH
jgi:polar amino acid transport system substrate-binding protein